VNIRTGSTETPSGQDVALSRDIVRTRSEGPLFRSTETRTGSSRSIRESDSTQEVQTVQDGLFRSEQARVVETASRTAEDSGDVRAIGETTSIISNSRGVGGSGGSGASGRGVSSGGSGSGQVGGTRTRTDLRAEEFDFSDQVARGVSDTIGVSAGSSQAGGGSQGAGADLADNLFGGQEGSQSQEAQADVFQGTQGETREVQRAPETSEPVLGSRASELQVGQETTRDPEPGLDTGVVDTGGPDLDQQTRDPLDQGQGIFEDPGQDQRDRDLPAEGESQVPGQDQVPGLGQELGNPQRQEDVPLQETSVFTPQDTQLDQREIQRLELQTRQPIRATGRPGRGTPAPPPGLPGGPLIGGGGFGSGSPSGQARRSDSEFAPSIEGIALGLESDIEEDEDVTLTGLEPRGIPAPEEQDDQGRRSEDDNPFQGGLLF